MLLERLSLREHATSLTRRRNGHGTPAPGAVTLTPEAVVSRLTTFAAAVDVVVVGPKSGQRVVLRVVVF